MHKLLVAVFLSIVGLTVAAQTIETTPNLVGGVGTWHGIGGYSQLDGQHPTTLWGCCTSYSGASPFHDISTTNGNGQSGQFIWSYGNATINHIIGVNTALSGTGIQVNGYNWSYDVRNMNGYSTQGGTDSLTASSILWNANNTAPLLSESRVHNTRTEWTTFSSTVTAQNPYNIQNVGNLQISFNSRDAGFWGGYYGPQIRNVQASLNYSVAAVDPCIADPLSSTTCPGYTQAMCTANQLFSTACPGYTQAMCSSNQLFSTTCPGYAQAYLDLQCSINPLYSTTCAGYEVAYFNQQCTADPLYNSACSGYADAYYVQQCTANPLYDSGCNGYAQAYFDQQCSLNGLYDRTCPNYAQAYAANMLLNKPVASTPVVVASQVNETTPALVSDPVVNQTLTTTSTSAAPATTATTVVPLAPAPSASPAPAAPAKEETKAEAKTESKSESSTSTNSSSSEKKDEPKSTRQQLAERRLEAARAKAVEQGKNLANDMGNVASMEQQVALQNVVMQAMGFTVGFDAYNQRTIQDTPFYKPFEIYRGNNNIDAPSSRRLFGGSDLKHEQLVDQQYNLGK